MIDRPQGPGFQWEGLVAALNLGIGQRGAWSPGIGLELLSRAAAGEGEVLEAG